MAGFPRPWFLAGGWALDLWLGRVTLPHEDMEIAILRRDQAEIRQHLAGWEFDKVIPAAGEHRRVPWREGELLAPPVHETYARRPAGTPREIEILLNEAEGNRWRFRRDATISRPLGEAGILVAGIPVLAPGIVLLYKAKAPRPRDEEDFRNSVGRLSPAERRWLRSAIEAVHPGHPWIEAL